MRKRAFARFLILLALGREAREPGPGLERIGALDHVHPGVAVALQGLFRILGEVCGEPSLPVRHRHGGHAVLHDVDLLGEGRILHSELLADIIGAGLDAVASGLADDDHRVVVDEEVEEARVLLGQRLAVPARQDLGPEDAVVLGQGVAPLDLGEPAASPEDRVVEAGLFDDAGQRVPRVAEHAVEGPEVQGVLAALLQLGAVVLHLLHEPAVVVAGDPVGDRGVGANAAVDHGAVQGEVDELAVVERDEGVLVERLSVHGLPERREEALMGEVRVERDVEVGDHAGVAVEELGDADVVVDGAGAAASRHEQGAAHAVRRGLEAEVLLEIDAQHGDAELVRAAGQDPEALLGVQSGAHDGGVVGAIGPDAGIPRSEERREVHVPVFHDDLSLCDGAV